MRWGLTLLHKLDDHLADVLASKKADEGSHGLIESVHHGFQALQLLVNGMGLSSGD